MRASHTRLRKHRIGTFSFASPHLHILHLTLARHVQSLYGIMDGCCSQLKFWVKVLLKSRSIPIFHEWLMCNVWMYIPSFRDIKRLTWKLLWATWEASTTDNSDIYGVCTADKQPRATFFAVTEVDDFLWHKDYFSWQQDCFSCPEEWQTKLLSVERWKLLHLLSTKFY